jgi:hypothetical protein
VTLFPPRSKSGSGLVRALELTARSAAGARKETDEAQQSDEDAGTALAV